MNFLNGQWQPGQGAEFVSENPATGEVLWTGRAADGDQVAQAVAAAAAALPAWSRRSLADRSEIVEKFGQLLQHRRQELALLISNEVGKPRWDANSEVSGMVGKIPVTKAALAERRSNQQFDLNGVTAQIDYRPLGIVAVYGPFNFPGHIANGQIVPALLAGNTIVFKPSELTPLVAEETVRLWEEAGIPAGVLNLIQGARETGEALAAQDRLNGLLFTGSVNTGIALRRQFADRPQTLLALELGGNSPLVIHRPDDIQAAVEATIQSAYLSSGQRCTCARRLIVTDGNDDYLDQLAARVRQITVGPPGADPEPFMGPLIHARAAAQTLAEQQRLLSGGARAIVAAQPLEFGPAFVSPALIDVTDCNCRRDEELFGPLLQLIRVPDLDTAIASANETRYGLVAALCTRDREDFDRFHDAIHAGLINWNRPTTGASGQLPFGGLGLSGNHRPAGYFTVDYCNVPVASLTAAALPAVPGQT